MGALRMEQVLKDKQSADLNSITSLSLPYKSLSDVSCLAQLSNLDRLDLDSNNLTSLEGLRLCVNLKWLSVKQNKLQSLKGIQNLSKLTVLNAGKNKLKSMDEVRSLLTLRALILNDNEIVSICKLNNIKELNTLVLSRNPIREIGESLVEVKSITKLSLSNCHLQTIGSSLKSCTELKELRLAHNDIKTVPAELAYNKKLQNLDLGNNVITTWSDVKVLASLVDLKNLNLQGNPITEMDKLTKKVKKLLLDLHIFNARPIEKGSKRVDSAIDALESDFRDEIVVDKKLKRKKVHEQDETKNLDSDKAEKKPESKKKREELNEVDVIDDGDTSFADFFSVGAIRSSENGVEKKMVDKDKKVNSGQLAVSVKKKKNKNHGIDSVVQIPEVGIGGPSTWDG